MSSPMTWGAWLLASWIALGAIVAIANWICDQPNPECSLYCPFCGLVLRRRRFETVRHYEAREDEHLRTCSP